MTKYNLHVADDENGTPYCMIHNTRMSLRAVQQVENGKINVYECPGDSTYIEYRGIKDIVSED